MDGEKSLNWKNGVIHFRISPEMKKKWMNVAEERHVSLSNFIRNVVEEHINSSNSERKIQQNDRLDKIMKMLETITENQILANEEQIRTNVESAFIEELNLEEIEEEIVELLRNSRKGFSEEQIIRYIKGIAPEDQIISAIASLVKAGKVRLKSENQSNKQFKVRRLILC